MAVKSLSIRIDEEMLNKLHVVADYEGRSANSQILILIRDAIEKYEEKHGKMLDEYLKKTKKGGTREILYTNTHCMSHEMSAEHPEYSQQDKNGNIMHGYNVFNFICVNPEGPFHKQFLKDVAGENREKGTSLANDICKNYRREGLFFDELLDAALEED